MAGQARIIELMQREFLRCQSRNSSYSLRAYAKKLGLFPSALSEILNGKRPITRKMGQKILTRLAHDPAESGEILLSLKGRNTKPSSGPHVLTQSFTQLSSDQYRVLSDWYYFALLSLAETAGFRPDPKWIARRLGIRVSEARTALARLKRLGLLVQDTSGKISPTGASLTTTSDVRDLSLQKSHHQNLDLARRSLDEDSVEIRDITAITLAIAPSKMKRAKERIQRFRREMAEFLEAGEKEEVYKLCIQLFPVSKRVPEKGKSHD